MDTNAVETHISRVFMTGDRAYKLLKAVDAGFVDFTDRENRLVATEREYELNRRIAPDVYLGLADVREHGELVDRMVVMRRMPDDRRLLRMLAAADGVGGAPGQPESMREVVADCLERVARSVAALHASFEPARGVHAAMATRDSVARHWEENFAAIEPHAGTVVDAREFDTVRGLARDYLAAGEELFAGRIERGWVRDGHGDLRAEDIFCLDDGPRILDCLAFADEYRVGDVLADIGFLAMDVHHVADPRLADRLLDAYREFSGESHPQSLARHYVAYRAHVRVKIACIKHEQGDSSALADAAALHELALEQLRAARLRVVLVGGGPGTGKSTLARALSDDLGLSLCCSDEVRKEIAGLGRLADASADPGEGIYTTEWTDRTYAELVHRARSLLARGESVVLDASWSAGRHREAVRAAAAEFRAPLVEIRCSVAPDIAVRRVSGRTGDPSDATPEVVEAMAASADDWPAAATIDTSATPAEVAARARGIVEQQLG